MSNLNALSLPLFLYGTAWKEAETERLALLAVQQGFRGIDTANQRKHYHEAGVGAAIQAAIRDGLITREDLFLQTKFTFRGGQDHRLPYDEHAPPPQQVQQSFASSLEHLGVSSLDSYVLHGPSQRVGLVAADWEAWRAMEQFHAEGKTRFLGISNVSSEQLEQLIQGAKVKPRFVQNRCYASRGWDREVRKLCTTNNIIYQGFSLLTANRDVLVHPLVASIAQRYRRATTHVVFRFALDVGMLPLTGTTSTAHMQADLDVANFQLLPSEVAQIEAIAEVG